MTRYSGLARLALWAVVLGGLATLVSGPITVHLVGPAVLRVVRDPIGSTWDPVIGGLSLTLAGALVVLVLGRIVQLPPKLAAIGVGGVGTFWMALIAALSGGWSSLWGLGLVFRLLFAGLAALVAGILSRVGYKPPAPTPTTPLAPSEVEGRGATPTETPTETPTPEKPQPQ